MRFFERMGIKAPAVFGIPVVSAALIVACAPVFAPGAKAEQDPSSAQACVNAETARFVGEVGRPDETQSSRAEAFVAFLDDNIDQTVQLDIILDRFQSDMMRNPFPLDAGGTGFVFDIPDNWREPGLGGIEVEFLIALGDWFVFVPFPGPAQIQGCFTIAGPVGPPEQDYSTYRLAPATALVGDR